MASQLIITVTFEDDDDVDLARIEAVEAVETVIEHFEDDFAAPVDVSWDVNELDS